MERRDAEAQSLFFFKRAKHTESGTYLRALCLLSKLFLCVFVSLRSIFSQNQYFESNGVPYHAFEKWYKKKLQQAGIADCVVEGAPSSASHPIGSVIFNGLLAIKKDPQLLFVGLCPITVISVL